MKISIVGYGRHGKDTVCEMLRDQYKYRFTSSSLYCAEKVMLPWFTSHGKHYLSAQDCFDDRHNYRSVWYEAITAFNTPDRSKLAKAILENHDIYCGIRNWKEHVACVNQGLFDVTIWVDRSDHQPPEPKTSMTVEPWMADYILDNNGSLQDLRESLWHLMQTINNRRKR